MTFDLGRVTTITADRTVRTPLIAVTFDLGRVTTQFQRSLLEVGSIAVTFDLGRVTTDMISITDTVCHYCGDVRSRTSYNQLKNLF